MRWLNSDELSGLGLKHVGKNVKIDPLAVFIHPERIAVGDNARIDAWSLLSAGPDGIHIGSYVHIAAGAYLFGTGGEIKLSDFAMVSSRAMIYTANDDYRDGHLIGPTVPDEFRKVHKGQVIIGRYAAVGAGSIILPGVILGLGSAVGAMSLVKFSVSTGDIVAGVPARTVGTRELTRLWQSEDKLHLSLN